MFKYVSIAVLAALVLAAGSDEATARGRRYRRYRYYQAPVASVPVTTPATSPAQPAPPQANRQPVRRYSYAPAPGFLAVPAYGSYNSDRPPMEGRYGRRMWRADRKATGYDWPQW